jgi:hypothetical protein
MWKGKVKVPEIKSFSRSIPSANSEILTRELCYFQRGLKFAYAAYCETFAYIYKLKLILGNKYFCGLAWNIFLWTHFAVHTNDVLT